jgi:hypothetical protein
MRDVEIMDSYDLLETIKAGIEKSRESQRSLADDVVRILKFKQGLILADPSNATRTLAERGVSYDNTKNDMDKVLELLRHSTDADATNVSTAVEKYLNAEEQAAREGQKRKEFRQLRVMREMERQEALKIAELQERRAAEAAQRRRAAKGVRLNANLPPPSHQPDPSSDDSDDTLDHSNSQSQRAIERHDPYSRNGNQIQHEVEGPFFKLGASGNQVVKDHLTTSISANNITNHIPKKCSHPAGQLETSVTSVSQMSQHQAEDASPADNGSYGRKKRYHQPMRCTLPGSKAPGKLAQETPSSNVVHPSDFEIFIPARNDYEYPPPSGADALTQAYRTLSIDKPHLATNEEITEKYTHLREKCYLSPISVKLCTDALDIIADSRKSLCLLTKRFNKAAPASTLEPEMLKSPARKAYDAMCAKDATNAKSLSDHQQTFQDISGPELARKSRPVHEYLAQSVYSDDEFNFNSVGEYYGEEPEMPKSPARKAYEAKYAKNAANPKNLSDQQAFKRDTSPELDMKRSSVLGTFSDSVYGEDMMPDFHNSGYDRNRFVPGTTIHDNEDGENLFVPETDAGSVYGDDDEGDLFLPYSPGCEVLCDDEQDDEEDLFLPCSPEEERFLGDDMVMQYESSGDENLGVFTPDTEDSEKYRLNDVLSR